MGAPRWPPYPQLRLAALAFDEARGEIAIVRQHEQRARDDARVREVGEDAVHAQLEEHEDLADGVGLVVRRQPLGLAPERPRVYEQAVPVRALDQIGRAQQRAIRLVDLAV